jgi:S-formylglutathione hydrolase FrmB
MAFLDVHAFSDVLRTQVSFHVLLPQQTTQEIGLDLGKQRTSHPVLWLLHGLSDDHTIWLRRTSIERYAAAKNLAVIMPAAGRSFYQDMVGGPRYWTFLINELPALSRSWFPISAERGDNFVAGLSMGGYGALRLALAYPERYAAAASLSGALDIPRRLREADKECSRISRAEWISIFGPELQAKGTSADLDHLAETAARSSTRPQIFLSCGTDDELVGESRAFRDRLNQLHYDHTYEEHPGDHEWAFWDTSIQRVLDWLPLRK